MSKSIKNKILIPMVISVLGAFMFLLAINSLLVYGSTKREADSTNNQAINNVYYVVDTFHTNMEQYRAMKNQGVKDRLKSEVETAVSLVNAIYEKSQKGEFSKDKAQKMAKDILRNLRYGVDGYFWVDNTDYKLMVLPPNPAQEGMDRSEVKDVNGKRMVRELVDGAVKNGEVFVEYYFRKLGDENASPKIGYARLFAPWGWVIGTGEYIDNIEREMLVIMKEDLAKLNENLYKDNSDKSYPFIKDRSGKYIAYYDQSLVNKVVKSKDAVTGDDLTEKYFEKKSGIYEYNYKKSDNSASEKKYAYIKYHEKLDWIIVYTHSKEELVKPLFRSVFLIIGVTVFVIILIIFLSYFIISRVSRGIVNARNLFLDISTGDGDLTKRLKIDSDDEVGDLSGHFNVFVEKLAVIISDIKRVMDNSRSFGVRLSANVTELSATVQELSATMTSISEKTGDLNTELLGAKDRIDGINEKIKVINLKIGEQSGAMSLASSSIEELIASVGSISQIADEKKRFVDELTVKANRGAESMKETLEHINDISGAVNEISSMLSIINSVASETNILAMNASIEAAHAGEAGKGFSVVADEVRKLAETTGDNAKNISLSVKSIIDKINSAVDSTGRSGEIFDAVIMNITEVNKAFSEMNLSLTEMNTGTKEITIALSSINEITNNVKDMAASIGADAGMVTESLNQISMLSSQNLSGVNEISIGTSEISKSIIELNEIANVNSENIGVIKDKIDSFKI